MSNLTWFKSSYSDSTGGECLEAALDWTKSSYSDNTGGECVEAAGAWAKSSYSDSSGGDCVEVAATSTIHIRDSKDIAQPSLRVSPAAWGVFIADVGTRPRT
ncbi:DUF397 domain-containing protein [Streptomyces sp. NBC_00878]|uniref:DUF397 domain-containing protein n=1 Tax=Streptomyces sp. NBC_00878 TaxID=2975854 RepID=UPI00224DEB2A|nr:DUF397 domain-containing protein [Streptomyces sp. NBC_00878]MCX4908555.1 DUF397 domain-containing protein [Streptomyces sp. NBC_00878]